MLPRYFFSNVNEIIDVMQTLAQSTSILEVLEVEVGGARGQTATGPVKVEGQASTTVT